MVINWNEILETITWTEVILPGLFTLTGAALGALLAGRYAVNAVKKQLKYDQQNKNLDMIDNDLKIGTQFVARVTIILDRLEVFEQEFLLGPLKKESKNAEAFTKAIENLTEYITDEYELISALPIKNLPYDYYIRYQKCVYYLQLMLVQLSILTSNKKLLVLNNKTAHPSKEKLEKSYNNFIKCKNNIERMNKEISKHHDISFKKYREIEKKIKY